MKILKVITVAIVLFVALAFGMNQTTAPAPVEKVSEEVKIAPHKLHGPIGMSDEDQF